MGIGISLLPAAAGAILIRAVHVTVHGVDLVTVGWILLIVGGIGAFASHAFTGSASRTEALEP